jgi:hypothetical protein
VASGGCGLTGVGDEPLETCRIDASVIHREQVARRTSDHEVPAGLAERPP